jgi:hypothetical protein
MRLSPARAILLFALVVTATCARAEEPLTWRSEWARQVALESNHRHDLALANARRLLSDSARTSAQFELLLDREAFNLFNLNRIEEGTACYDRQIAGAVDHPAERLRLLESKAQMLLSHVEPPRGISACRQFRLATEPKSEAWKRATAMLALELARNAEHDEAIALREELVENEQGSQSAEVSRLLAEIARSQQAMGRLVESRKSLERAEKALPVEGTTQEDERQIEDLRGQIASLHQLLRSGK